MFIMSVFLITNVLSCTDEYDDTAIWKEIEGIKASIDKMNSEISALQILTSALENKVHVVNVVEVKNGYEIVLSNGKKLAIENGKDGVDGNDGKDGISPTIGVDLFEGVYYWRVNGEWLTDSEGNKMRVSVETVIPEISVDSDNYWIVNGERISDGKGGYVNASGEKGDDGDSFFRDVEELEREVIFTLKDGSEIRINKVIDMEFVLAENSVTLGYGKSVQISVNQSGVKYTSISKPDGWRVELNEDSLIIFAPVRPNSYAEQSGVISIVVVGETSTIITIVDVVADPNISEGNAGDSEWENWNN